MFNHGSGSYAVTAFAQAQAVLSNPAAKYAENQLAAQLLGAELGIASGGAICPAILSTIADANSILSSIGYMGPPSSVIGPSSPLRAQALNDASALDAFTSAGGC